MTPKTRILLFIIVNSPPDAEIESNSRARSLPSRQIDAPRLAARLGLCGLLEARGTEGKRKTCFFLGEKYFESSCSYKIVFN